MSSAESDSRGQCPGYLQPHCWLLLGKKGDSTPDLWRTGQMMDQWIVNRLLDLSRAGPGPGDPASPFFSWICTKDL